ncbi:hypothetical protein [Runella sp. SP2]|uniref:hypothetical protein n=1 Tax=Runella sp. SP2 TaxID=2268026 RepID=UPI000F0879C6|nr:hypothetical protein [Runella sp. SP2]AYQ32316.1 hypothetical protein DTQ70_09050 [Runella sp. SP2]
MDPNKSFSVRELHEHILMLEQMLKNQAEILGIKDLLLYRLNERIDDLESQNNQLQQQATNLLWFKNRSN